jgi:hypothetical protein
MYARKADSEISIQCDPNDLGVIRIFDDFYSKRVIECSKLAGLKDERMYHGHKKTSVTCDKALHMLSSSSLALRISSTYRWPQQITIHLSKVAILKRPFRYYELDALAWPCSKMV